jgi:hypothetical protein
MIELKELTERVVEKLGGRGSYQITEWLVKTIVDEYEDSKPVHYRPLRNGIFQNDEKRT